MSCVLALVRAEGVWSDSSGELYMPLMKSIKWPFGRMLQLLQWFI